MINGIDFSAHVKEVLNRNNIQVQTLALIDPQLKNLYLQQQKKAILVVHNKVYERQVASSDDTTIHVSDSTLTPYLRKNQLILLVLPTGGKYRYVLQTTVDKIYVDRFSLTTLDPRKNLRFLPARRSTIAFHSIPDATAIRIQLGELRSIRQTKVPEAPGATEPPDENPDRSQRPKAQPEQETHAAARETTIQDILFKTDEDREAEDYLRITRRKPVLGTIVDLSLGGMCVLVNGADDFFFTDRLVLVKTGISHGQASDADFKQIKLSVFAVVRNLKKTGNRSRLNLEFLSRLPEGLESLLT